MDQKEQFNKIFEILSPKQCIIVTPRYEKVMGEIQPYGLTVLAQTSDNLGYSDGVGTRYDYGFLKLDIANGIAVIII